MGILRLAGGLGGVLGLLALLAFAISVGMWLVLMVTRRFSLVGRRHRHARWRDDQQNGRATLAKRDHPA